MISYVNGKYVVDTPNGLRDATQKEVQQAIAEAVRKDNWHTWAQLTCPCGNPWFYCNPANCNQGEEE